MAAVSAVGLSKHFGEVRAVDDLDLEIADGEFFSMLGPVGLRQDHRAAADRRASSSPTDGTDPARRRGRDRPAAVPRATSTPSSRTTRSSRTWTCSQNVEYGLRVKKVDRKERRRRAEEALAAVRLEGYGERRPHQLSGGQRQRVALARALVNRPKVLLLDEPLGALDLKLRREMQLELKQIQRDVGITFVFVTHDQEEALTMSDRVAVFNDGRVEQVATPVELYESPASPFVAGFVGTSNLLGGDAAPRLLGDAGRVRRPAREAARRARPGALGRRRRACAAPGVVREVVYLGPTHPRRRRARRRRRRLTVSHPNTGPLHRRAAARGVATDRSRVALAPRLT